MKNQIIRAKTLIRKHRDTIAYSSGVVMGVAGTYLVMSNHHITIPCIATPDQLKHLLENPLGAIKFDGKREDVILFLPLPQS